MALFLTDNQIKPQSFYHSAIQRANKEELSSLVSQAYQSWHFLSKTKETVSFINALFLKNLSQNPNNQEYFERILSKILDVKIKDNTITIQHNALSENFSSLQDNIVFLEYLKLNNIKNVVILRNPEYIQESSLAHKPVFKPYIPQIAKDYYAIWLELQKKIKEIEYEEEKKEIEKEIRLRQKLAIENNLRANNLPNNSIDFIKPYVADNDYKYLIQNLNLYTKNPDNLPILPKNLNYKKFIYFYGQNPHFEKIIDLFASTLVLQQNSLFTISQKDLQNLAFFDKNKAFSKKQSFFQSALSADFLFINNLDKISIFNIDKLSYIIHTRIKENKPIIIRDKKSKFFNINMLKAIIKKKSLYTLERLLHQYFYALELHEKDYKPFSVKIKHTGNPFFSIQSKAFRKIGSLTLSSIKKKIPLLEILNSVAKKIEAFNKKLKDKAKYIKISDAKEIATKIYISSLTYPNKP